MSEKLNEALYALLKAIEDEFVERDTKINILESKVGYLTDKTDRMSRNLKDAAGIFSAAAASLQEGLDDFNY